MTSETGRATRRKLKERLAEDFSNGLQISAVLTIERTRLRELLGMAYLAGFKKAREMCLENLNKVSAPMEIKDELFLEVGESDAD